MKIRSLAIRVVTIAIILGAIALVASPRHHVWEVWSLFAILVLSDVPAARAWRALTDEERAAAGTESAGQGAAWYVVFVLFVAIGIFMTRVGHVTSGYVVALVIPFSALYVGTSVLRSRRLRQVQAPTAYRRAVLLSSVLQLAVLGAALSMGARQ